ncbi:MAG: zinc-binding dehydrogenase [Candidatus Binataceae bacterium]|nr:zinc-binding dehydrogenase [Candidatus Binataceae bacterium]
MLAVQIVAPRKCELIEVPVPTPGPAQVRLRMEGSGVCASNLPLWEGREWFNYPVAPGGPGHEGWGTVDEVGEAVSLVRPGDRVAILSYRAFAEYDLAHEGQVIRLPEVFANKPFPAEAFGCAFNIFKRSDVHPGQTVAIVGVGFLGAVLTQLCSSAGATVIAISRRSTSLSLAREYGASHVLAFANDPVQEVARLTNRLGCERVIEAAGLQSTLNLASAIIGENGKLILAGYHQDGLRIVDLQRWNWLGIDVINAHERKPEMYCSGMRAAVEAAAEGVFDYSRLITHRLSVHELNEAFSALAERPQGFVKATVEFAVDQRTRGI